NIALCYVLFSLLEYFGHRSLMHRQRLAEFFHSSYLASTFYDHVVLHHARYFRVFNNEPDENGHKTNIMVRIFVGLAFIAPFCLIAYPIDRLTAVSLFLGAIAHNRAWTAIHSEMHIPRDRWFAQTFWFKYLRRYHFLHHRHPRRNFNTLLPLWD